MARTFVASVNRRLLASVLRVYRGLFQYHPMIFSDQTLRKSYLSQWKKERDQTRILLHQLIWYYYKVYLTSSPTLLLRGPCVGWEYGRVERGGGGGAENNSFCLKWFQDDVRGWDVGGWMGVQKGPHSAWYHFRTTFSIYVHWHTASKGIFILPQTVCFRMTFSICLHWHTAT